MLLYYAIGGGHGHLTRARAVLHTLRLEGNAMLLTASPFASDSRVTGQIPVLNVPEEVQEDAGAYRHWFQQQIERLSPERILVDTFPCGMFGELATLDVDRVLVDYVARYVRWERVQVAAGPELPEIGTTYVLEDLHPEQERVVERRSEKVEPLRLEDPPAEADGAMLRRLPDRYWLVVHSGPVAEVAQLVSYAEEIQWVERSNEPIVVVTPEQFQSGKAISVDVYPASSLFENASRVITACGFNAMRQLQPSRFKHRFVPFERRFDDQFLRASRARAEPVRGVAGSW